MSKLNKSTLSKLGFRHIYQKAIPHLNVKGMGKEFDNFRYEQALEWTDIVDNHQLNTIYSVHYKSITYNLDHIAWTAHIYVVSYKGVKILYVDSWEETFTVEVKTKQDILNDSAYKFFCENEITPTTKEVHDKIEANFKGSTFDTSINNHIIDQLKNTKPDQI